MERLSRLQPEAPTDVRVSVWLEACVKAAEWWGKRLYSITVRKEVTCLGGNLAGYAFAELLCRSSKWVEKHSVVSSGSYTELCSAHQETLIAMGLQTARVEHFNAESIGDIFEASVGMLGCQAKDDGRPGLWTLAVDARLRRQQYERAEAKPVELVAKALAWRPATVSAAVHQRPKPAPPVSERQELDWALESSCEGARFGELRSATADEIIDALAEELHAQDCDVELGRASLAKHVGLL